MSRRAPRCPCAARRHVLACGAELKSTFCVAKDDRAWVGHHIGDLRNADTLAAFREGIGTSSGCSPSRPRSSPTTCIPTISSTVLRARARGRRARSACSTITPTSPRAWPSTARPTPRSARSTTARGSAPTERCGAARSWSAICAGSRAPAHLLPVRLPGGDRAAREPWRMACAWLVAAMGPAPELPAQLAGDVDARALGRGRADGRHRLLRAGHDQHGPAVRRRRGAVRRAAEVTYEGQAAIELEAVADRSQHGAYELPVDRDGAARRAPGDPRRRRRRARRHRRGGRSRRASIARSPLPRRPHAPPRPRPRAPTWSCSPAACSRTGCCSMTRAPACAGSACACSCRSACRPTTAGSPTDRRRSPRRGPERVRPRRSHRGRRHRRLAGARGRGGAAARPSPRHRSRPPDRALDPRPHRGRAARRTARTAARPRLGTRARNDADPLRAPRRRCCTRRSPRGRSGRRRPASAS